MLYQAKGIIDKKDKSSAGTAMNEGNKDKSGYSDVMSSLNDLIGGKVSAKDFEAKCRKTVGEDVYNFVAIPPLVESCAEAIIKVTKEGCIENLYNCSQLKLKVSINEYIC